jgi:Phage-related protein, predicted endonuclease
MGKMKAAAAAAEESSPEFIVPDLTPQQKEMRSKGSAAPMRSGSCRGLVSALGREDQAPGPGGSERVLPVQMGKVTEAFNAHWFRVQTGIHVNRAPSVVERCHVHPAYPHMLCNIDGLVIVDGRLRLFEAKHVNPFGSKGDQPAKHYAQIQHCLEVLDLEGCELSVFFGSMDWSRFSIERDRDYGALLIDRELEFWNHVRSDKPPERTEAVTGEAPDST